MLDNFENKNIVTLDVEGLTVVTPKAILAALKTLDSDGSAHNDHQQHHDSDNR